ncbi:MAG TPA: histidine kinase [Terriglobales bacterium]|nr:histidine kinase [Terriglobales bacterium]
MAFLAQIPFVRLRPRSFWRNARGIAPEEVHRVERWLATARVFLAMSALVAVWINPREVRSAWAYALLTFYITHGAAIIFLLRSWTESSLTFRVVVHAADVFWPALISLTTSSQSYSFFLFFFFVIVAAAYRWGVWETVSTSVAAASMLWLQSLVLRLGAVSSVDRWLSAHALPVFQEDVVAFDPKRLFMRSVYLVVIGVLLGYLAEQQKKLRAEKDEAVSMLGMVRMDTGLAFNLSLILSEMMRLYRSRRCLLASRESGSPKISLAKIEMRRETPHLEWLDPGPSGGETYLFASGVTAFYAQRERRRKGEYRGIGLTPDGVLSPIPDDVLLERISAQHGFEQLLTVSFSSGADLSGRIFFLDPELSSNSEEDLRFLQDLVRQIGPAVYNVYLVRRLRRRAGALERARLVRELHDGAVQSLIGVEMQMDVLRRSHPVAVPLDAELERIQKLLREEVLKLRELMQEMKSVDIDARRLPSFLHDAVDRFQRETGIRARFVMDDQELTLPQPVCRELARITQEALVNVRKHSGAAHVLVQLLESKGSWELIVEDDGTGFPFTGRLSSLEVETAPHVPAIIRERVRLIEGHLTIESRPGRGSRVEVRVAQNRQAAHG